MKVIIIEDELPAAEKLARLLAKCDVSISVAAILPDLKSSIAFFKTEPAIDLAFMDIQLSDGQSLDIFNQVEIKCPVIFTTAYDDYWQQAFERNGIDYLLKPVSEEKLKLSLRKYDTIRYHFQEKFRALKQSAVTEKYKSRFLVKRGIDYKAIKAENIAYFFATHKVVCLVERGGQKYIMDTSLNDLEKEVSPDQFYRVNRKFLVNLDAIARIIAFPKSKLMLELAPAIGEEVIVSQENVAEFKNWMNK